MGVSNPLSTSFIFQSHIVSFALGWGIEDGAGAEGIFGRGWPG